MVIYEFLADSMQIKSKMWYLIGIIIIVDYLKSLYCHYQSFQLQII